MIWCNIQPLVLWEVSEFFVVEAFLRDISRMHFKSKFHSASSHFSVTVSLSSHANLSDNLASLNACKLAELV